jgi:SAM-dependent methyltransferase
MLIYSALAANWYHLLDPVEDHADEAACYEAALLRGVSGAADTLLELGCGAGNNAFHMKRQFRCTLTDHSIDMLALSRRQNPDCEHFIGDMRSLRLGRQFDAVFVHDAVMYITIEDDLQAVAETAFVHTRPGGAALFAPDFVKETFVERSELLAGDADGRSLRCVEWFWDPDSTDSTFTTDYVFALREAGIVTVHHDRHIEGLFGRDTWLRILSSAGFVAEPVDCGLEDLGSEVFLCRRP